jgi:hypothetical protein
MILQLELHTHQLRCFLYGAINPSGLLPGKRMVGPSHIMIQLLKELAFSSRCFIAPLNKQIYEIYNQKSSFLQNKL